MRYRQIHLDFHTAPSIPDVGSRFDADDFVKTLTDAHVDSINIFAKCHHGMCYYPTKVGIMHPSLKFDLLGTMIDKLHKAGITCPVYYPLGWEETAAKNEQWLEIGKDGILGHKLPFDSSNCSWRKLCLNNPEYLEFVKSQLTELMNGYDIDGFWFDIIFQQKCLCRHCIAEMKEMGLDPENETDVLKHDEHVLVKLQKQLNDFVAGFGKGTTTFYNSSWAPDGGYDGYSIDRRAAMQSHVEIESLPSGKWGYNHFPLFVNYHNRHNGELIGMNGKFHLSWGDHGSLKNNEALEYECFRMVANGCACSVGDQLHPRGYMNKAAYERIGRVYAEIEKIEGILENSKKTAEIGVIVSSTFFDDHTESDEGVMRMLMELHYTFDLISINDELSRYRLVILPDNVAISDELSAKLTGYIKNGGKVLATCKSTDEGSIGVKYIGENEYCPSYIVAENGFADVEELEYVCYERGAYVESSLPVKAYIGNPYFNRTYDNFSSHMHFPFDRKSEYPAVLLGENVSYCAFPLFKDYIINGNRVYRDIIGSMIKALLPSPVVTTSAPTCAEMTVREQESRTIVHVISYIAERRTRTIDVVDTRLPLYNTALSLRTSKKISSVLCARSGEKLSFTQTDGTVQVTVPVIDGYEAIVFQYE